MTAFNVIFFVVEVVASPYIIFKVVQNWDLSKEIWRKATVPTIKLESTFKDEKLIEKVLKTSCAQNFSRALEYQKMEGYCASTTVRVSARECHTLYTSHPTHISSLEFNTMLVVLVSHPSLSSFSLSLSLIVCR
jgi:hypothetical protein